MKCKKCGAELLTDVEIKNGICTRCVSAQLATDDTYDDEEVAPRNYFVLNVLSVIGKLIVACSCIMAILILIALGIGDAPGIYIGWLIVTVVVGMLSSSLLFAVREILNALYDIRDKL